METGIISVMTTGKTGTYLLNSWYIAAWAYEVQPGGHMKRILLDRPVLLMRAEDGNVAAIGNVCPHRFASLSGGEFSNGLVECPYHGLRFDMTGQCVHNPHGDGRIAERARVPSFPLVERHGALWIWFGDPMLAEPEDIPDLSFLNTPKGEDHSSGYLRTEANYQLLSDNILDLTHADFIHRSTLGTEGELTGSEAKARLKGNSVTVEWSFVGKVSVVRTFGTIRGVN